MGPEYTLMPVQNIPESLSAQQLWDLYNQANNPMIRAGGGGSSDGGSGGVINMVPDGQGGWAWPGAAGSAFTPEQLQGVVSGGVSGLYAGQPSETASNAITYNPQTGQYEYTVTKGDHANPGGESEIFAALMSAAGGLAFSGAGLGGAAEGGMGAGADIYGNFNLGAMGDGLTAATGGAVGAGTSVLPQWMQQLTGIPGAPQVISQLLGAGGGGGGGAGAGGAPGGLNLGSLLPLLGVGSGLNTMLNSKPAVDPAMTKALWQAGQQTYQTALDPQSSLYNRTAQQTQDQVRAGESARGITMSPYGAGVEGKAMSDFNIDWQNQQLQRQVQGLQGFSGAGNTAANAGVANNAQAFMQNQTGLNNLTTGLGGLFGQGGQGVGGGASFGAGAANPIGAWLNSLFKSGAAPGAGPASGGSSIYSPGGDPSGYYGAGDTGWGGVGEVPY